MTSPLAGLLPKTSRNFDHLVTETAQRGTFMVTVTEKGSLDSMRNATLSCKVEGQTTIIQIVPEGTAVKAGDLVCELDASALTDKEIQQQIKVTQANAAMKQAEKEVEIQKAQNESDIDAAHLALELAVIDQEKFLDGDYKQQEIELETAVQVQVENLSRAKEYLSFLERLVKKGYRMQSDLDAEKIAFNKANNDRKVAGAKLRVLQDYTFKRTKSELIAKVKDFGLQITRKENSAAAALAQKEADLKAKTLTNDVETRLLERLNAQIKDCKLYAPQDGQVVYANSRESWGNNQAMIERGATVRERQAIINLPDLTAMKVNAKIHESRIGLVRAGLTAKVKIDAAPTEDFHGVIDTVSNVPGSINWSNRDLKEYDAVVRLTDDDEHVSKLRPGLNATIEILVDQREDVLQVPVQSLISIVDQRFLYVLGENGPEQRAVKIGDTNERTVEILDGVKEGERVVMNPRSQFGKEIAELETKLNKEKAEQAPDSKSPGEGASPAVPKAVPKAAPSSGGSQGAPLAATAAPNAKAGADPSARFKKMDQNGDGKLSAEETPAPMKPRFGEIDSDKNGTIDEKEFAAFAAKFSRPAAPPAAAGD